MRRPLTTTLLFLAVVPVLTPAHPGQLGAQDRQTTPIRQSDLTFETAAGKPLTLRDASRDDRWLGLEVRDVRWAPDGSVVYFRWNRRPQPGDLADADPWFRADKAGGWVEEVPDNATDGIPGATVFWSNDERRATWIRDGAVYLFDEAAYPTVRRVVSLDRPARSPRFTSSGDAIDFEVGETLYRYHISIGSVTVLAAKITVDSEARTDAAEWLAGQQRELFEHIRWQEQQSYAAAALARASDRTRPQPIPVPASVTVDGIQLSPDGRYVTFRASRESRERPNTQYVDYVDESGYSRVRDARSKVGEPRDEVRLGFVTVDPTVPPESVVVRWVDLGTRGISTP